MGGQNMARAQIKGKLTSRVGRPVAFRAPGDVGKKGGSGWKGKIIDEVWADLALNESPPHGTECPNGKFCDGDFSFCAQLIEWTEAKYTNHLKNIRLAYYRRRCGEDGWEYASQMTVCTYPEIVHDLCRLTLGKTDWFPETG